MDKGIMSITASFRGPQRLCRNAGPEAPIDAASDRSTWPRRIPPATLEERATAVPRAAAKRRLRLLGESELAERLDEPRRVDGLHEVRVEAGLLGARAVLRLAVAGERDELDPASEAVPEPARHLVAVDVGQPDVDEHDVGRARERRVDPLLARAGLADV